MTGVFWIGFRSEPALRDEETGHLHRYGRIRIGDFVEDFDCPLGFWDAGDFERQWLEGAQRTVDGAGRSCLLTQIHPPETGGWSRWWAMYLLDGETVAVQEQIHLSDWGPVDPSDPYASVHDYESESEDGPISEWRLTRRDLVEFVRAHR